jgi:alpha-L-fucosidase
MDRNSGGQDRMGRWAGDAGTCEDATTVYEGTWDSVRTHRVPDWYEDAKLGVFLHWGLYSVPGWAPRVPDIQEMLVKNGPKRMLRENPYAEWYLNTMQVRGSPTQRHHREVYGDNYPYDNFVKTFNDASRGANVDALAGLCQAAGARYVVLTTKHHEGFALWPSSVQHPVKGAYHAGRDLAGGCGWGCTTRAGTTGPTTTRC